MKFVTESGSLYEVDLSEKKTRRLIGVSNPTSRQKNDGEWQTYQYIFPTDGPVKGKPVVFVWDIKQSGIAPSTVTSTVARIEESS